MQGSIYLWSWTQTLKGRQDKRSKKVKVVILAELQWSDTDLPYITLCTCPEDYLLCGDEKGRVWMYELSSFLQKRMVSEIIPPTQVKRPLLINMEYTIQLFSILVKGL
nr:PREDICTED: leucine-rich repeat and WD repeat-containing protein 1-like [Latimeria chalumnae]|eukprot:XP_014339861.1 PREDICTED: leucine-rich repeat and WD repeat-containing protein 1-like [Latimeria chalumnae]